MNEDCLFCKIRDNQMPSHRVYEDNTFFAILDIKPVNPGHVLVLPKEHHRNLLDISPEVANKYTPVVQKIALAVKQATNADGVTITSNNEHAGGQLIFHTHIHIIPRFDNDNLMHWDHNFYNSEDEMPLMAEKIISSF